ncbi:MAG: VOC family protein [Proteobacteria bacterium]|nr:VOC family protein [Pseudomonadota bacterium]
MLKTIFSHVAVSCKDPVRLERFYTKYFGFKRARVYSPGPDQVVMIKSGQIYLELFKATQDPLTPPPTDSGPLYPSWKHICFLVDDLDLKLRKLGDAVTITLGPSDMGQFVPGMKVCWIADPEDNIVELNQGYRDEEDPPQLAEGGDL